MGVNLYGKQMDDVKVGVETLGKALRQLFLEGYVQIWVVVDCFLELLQRVAQICPFSRFLKLRVDVMKL